MNSVSIAILVIAVIAIAVLGGILCKFVSRNRKLAASIDDLNNARQENEKQIADAQEKAESIRRRAKQEADIILKEAKLHAKEEVLAAKDDFEKSTKQRRQELQTAEERISAKEDSFSKKLEQVEQRLNDLDRRDQDLKVQSQKLASRQEELDTKIAQEIQELERVASMTQDEAKKILLDRLEGSLEVERGTLIRRFQEENKMLLEKEGQEVMIAAMQRYAGECAYERTTSTISLQSDEVKGRIIGREGRNIRTIEAATGANILIDDTPEAVVISCFDPIRREIARIAMERLVADGRIHPARIEEIVTKVRKEIEQEIQKAGQDTVEKLRIPKLRPNIITLLGRLKFRYSYSQNVLMHSIEVASMMGAIAAQLGLDEVKARRAGLLHDIGKAVDHDIEGSHAVIGADLLKRAGEDEDVINAVAAHHEEVEKKSLLAYLVPICDTLSSSRPGARSETTELYLKRLEQLETIGKSFDGVESCFAIQAGRELRVIVKPEKINENQASVMARDIAARIEKEMRYPGQIRVSIIRETRSVEYAK